MATANHPFSGGVIVPSTLSYRQSPASRFGASNGSTSTSNPNYRYGSHSPAFPQPVTTRTRAASTMATSMTRHGSVSSPAGRSTIRAPSATNLQVKKSSARSELRPEPDGAHSPTTRSRVAKTVSSREASASRERQQSAPAIGASISRDRKSSGPAGRSLHVRAPSPGNRSRPDMTSRSTIRVPVTDRAPVSDRESHKDVSVRAPSPNTRQLATTSRSTLRVPVTDRAPVTDRELNKDVSRGPSPSTRQSASVNRLALRIPVSEREVNQDFPEAQRAAPGPSTRPPVTPTFTTHTCPSSPTNMRKLGVAKMMSARYPSQGSTEASSPFGTITCTHAHAQTSTTYTSKANGLSRNPSTTATTSASRTPGTRSQASPLPWRTSPLRRVDGAETDHRAPRGVDTTGSILSRAIERPSPLRQSSPARAHINGSSNNLRRARVESASSSTHSRSTTGYNTTTVPAPKQSSAISTPAPSPKSLSVAGALNVSRYPSSAGPSPRDYPSQSRTGSFITSPRARGMDQPTLISPPTLTSSMSRLLYPAVSSSSLSPSHNPRKSSTPSPSHRLGVAVSASATSPASPSPSHRHPTPSVTTDSAASPTYSQPDSVPSPVQKDKNSKKPRLMMKIAKRTQAPDSAMSSPRIGPARLATSTSPWGELGSFTALPPSTRHTSKESKSGDSSAGRATAVLSPALSVSSVPASETSSARSDSAVFSSSQRQNAASNDSPLAIQDLEEFGLPQDDSFLSVGSPLSDPSDPSPSAKGSLNLNDVHPHIHLPHSDGSEGKKLYTTPRLYTGASHYTTGTLKSLDLDSQRECEWSTSDGSVGNDGSVGMDTPKNLLGYVHEMDDKVHVACPRCEMSYSNTKDGPMTLLCSHTFCGGCVGDLSKAGVISCPKCHDVVMLEEYLHLRKNYAIGALKPIGRHYLRERSVSFLLESMDATCSICMELYTNIGPTLLGCGHTVCESCISVIKCKSDPQLLECPECRKVSLRIDSVPNAELVRLLQAVQEVKDLAMRVPEGKALAMK